MAALGKKHKAQTVESREGTLAYREELERRRKIREPTGEGGPQCTAKLCWERVSSKRERAFQTE